MTATVQEEDCDGLCWQYIANEGGIRPELVVITEPTSLRVYRGHRGRMEMEVHTSGISCHGSAPERGVNAVYKMADIIADIEALNENLEPREPLGKGTVTISNVRSMTWAAPSVVRVTGSAQSATPLNASLQLKLVVTSALYQPLALAGADNA